jgi:hypothetical protein
MSYPEPLRFSPERFLGAKAGTYTWFPFGGVRRCLGASFAMYEMSIVLQVIARRLARRPARPEPERVMRRAITLVPSRGGRPRRSKVGRVRVWLITGASSGFGRAIALAALARGDDVVAAGRNLESLRAIGPDDRVLPVRLDVTDAAEREAAVATAFDRFGRIDLLVNNAGRTQVGAVEETTDEELRALFELHFFGPAALTRLVLPVMRERGGGAIVQMSSVGGQVTAPGFGAYCATRSRRSASTP